MRGTENAGEMTGTHGRGWRSSSHTGSSLGMKQDVCISPRRARELTNVAVASSETFLALTLVLVWLGVGAGAAVLTGLVVAAVI